jgi:hypothetical protein
MWMAAMFEVSCMLGIVSVASLLFKRDANIRLGLLIIIGLVFQFIGHTCMGVSSSYPENMAAWGVQLVAFTLGKMMARATVVYAYYCCFKRINCNRSTVKYHLMICMLWLFAYIGLLTGSCLAIASLSENTLHPDQIKTTLIASAACLVAITVGFSIHVAHVIVKSRKEVPWHKLTWMSGYYVVLQFIPILLLTQDIYELVMSVVSWRDETVELLCNMGMTKSILLLLGSQSYEVAYALSQKRPKHLVYIEQRIKQLIHQKEGEWSPQ